MLSSGTPAHRREYLPDRSKTEPLDMHTTNDPLASHQEPHYEIAEAFFSTVSPRRNYRMFRKHSASACCGRSFENSVSAVDVLLDSCRFKNNCGLQANGRPI